MDTIITLLRADHARLSDLLATLEAGDTTCIPELRRLLIAHSHTEVDVLCPTLVPWHPDLAQRLASVLAGPREVRALSDSLDAAWQGGESLASVTDAVRTWLAGHVESSEAILLAPAETLIPPETLTQVSRQAVRLRGLDDTEDEGASSDGDRSWADSPMTQDPTLDRSVDAAIRRSGS